MVGFPAARLGDPHICPAFTGLVPHVGGPILPVCAVTVLTGKMPQARMMDMCTCAGPPAPILKGSATVYVNKMQAARMLDNTGHGGMIVFGYLTVLIGDGAATSVGAGGPEMPAVPVLGLEGMGADAAAMAKAMIAAGQEGKPFCEQCQRH